MLGRDPAASTENLTTQTSTFKSASAGRVGSAQWRQTGAPDAVPQSQEGVT